MPLAEQNDSQHEQLRQRLEDELALRNNGLDTAEYDWFMRSANMSPTSGGSMKPPSMTDSSKAPASVATTAAITTSSKDKNGSLGLVRCKTADLSQLSSSRNTKDDDDDDAEVTAKLTRTSTNVAASNVGRRATRPAPLKTSQRSTNLDIGAPPSDSAPASPLTVPSSNSSSRSSSPPKKKKGFFKKMFGKTKETPSTSARSSRHGSVSTTGTQSSAGSTRRSSIKSSNSVNPSTTPSVPDRGSISSSIESPAPSVSTADEVPSMKSAVSGRRSSLTLSPTATPSSSSTDSLSGQYKDIDPILAQYLHEIHKVEAADESERASVESAFKSIYAPTTGDTKNYSKSVVPPHPDQPKLPSAFASNPRYGGSIELELWNKVQGERAAQGKESGGFGFLKRTKSPDGPLRRFMVAESDLTPPLNFKPIPYTKPPPKFEKKPPMETLREIKPMKKVAFATTVFVNDPPQQIPSRHPRKGNVEIRDNGELVIHKLTREEREKATSGLVVGGSGHLKLMNEVTTDEAKKQSKTIGQADKDLAAKKAVESAGTEKNDKEQDAAAVKSGKQIKIDTPMVRRRRQMEKPVVTLKIDELYTRCCHLREILPIPGTLKQIPEGSTDPIPVLTLRNPRPSMIEILAFTDFIRIAPIICLSLNGVELSHEMLRLILSALLYKRYLEKLSLRNTPIDAEGWRMLCYFLSMNKALKRLDVTQCPALVVNTQKPHRKKANAPVVERMKCNMLDRSDMDWQLMTASLIYRGGITEMILSGCKVPDNVFKNLLNLGLTHTEKLGLAYNEITNSQSKVVAEWMASNQDCLGIDLGYNDMSNNLKPFIKYAESANWNYNLSLISLNASNLLDTPDTERLFNSLSKLQHLKYLDISDNKKLFPDFTTKLCTYLPLFGELVRLNIDDNALETMSIVQLCTALPLMKKLTVISMKGIKMDETACGAMCKALQDSPTLYTFEFDKEDVPESYQRRFGLLTMQNMERSLYEEHMEKKFTDASLRSAEDEKIRKELDMPEGMSFSDLMRIMLKNPDSVPPDQLAKFMDIAQHVRTMLQSAISDLMKLQLQGELSFEGKGFLVRLVNVDATFTKCLELITDDETVNQVGNFQSSMGAREYFSKTFESDRQKSVSGPSSGNGVDTVPFENDTTLLQEESRANSQASSAEPPSSAEMIRKASSSMVAEEGETLKKCSGENQYGEADFKKLMPGLRDPLELMSVMNMIHTQGLKLSDLFKQRDITEENTSNNAKVSISTELSEPNDASNGVAGPQSGAPVDKNLLNLYDNVLKDISKRTQAKTKAKAANSEDGAPLKKVTSL